MTPATGSCLSPPCRTPIFQEDKSARGLSLARDRKPKSEPCNPGTCEHVEWQSQGDFADVLEVRALTLA